MKPTIPLLSGTGKITDVEIATEIVEQAKELPYGHEAYFTLGQTTLTMPISDLVWERARPEGIKNAIDRMSRALQGTYPKRRPLKVEACRQRPLSPCRRQFYRLGGLSRRVAGHPLRNS
jgi:hypothetical protein